MSPLGEAGYERQLRKLARRAGSGWEIVTAGAVEVGDTILTEDKGPLKVTAIASPNYPPEPPPEDGKDSHWRIATDMIREAPPPRPGWGDNLALNLENRSIWLGVSMKKLIRRARSG